MLRFKVGDVLICLIKLSNKKVPWAIIRKITNIGANWYDVDVLADNLKQRQYKDMFYFLSQTEQESYILNEAPQSLKRDFVKACFQEER
jgi:hypothetical protein